VKLEVVTIGTELLLGQILDTNAAELGRGLAAAGVEVVRRSSVADRPEAIRAAVADALERTGFVITTGGLGPTRDDMTKREVAALFGKALQLDPAVLHSLEERFRRLGRPMPAVNRTQAEVPEGATVLPNPRGTAPGLWVEDSRGRVVVMLPGVPSEMRGLLAEQVLPRLVGLTSGAVVRSRSVRTTGIAESALAERVGAIEEEIAPLTLAYLPSTDGVDLRVTAWGLRADEAEGLLEAAAAQLPNGTNLREIHEARQGYGFAIQRGLREATGDYIVISEPDGTFLGRDTFKLLAYVEDFDVVYGSRTARTFIWRGANMGAWLRWGNWGVAKLMEFLFNSTNLTDVGCTMRLVRRDALAQLENEFTIGGSAFGPEMMLLSLLHGLRVIQVPVNYLPRIGVSSVTGDTRKALLLGLWMIGLVIRYRLRSWLRR